MGDIKPTGTGLRLAAVLAIAGEHNGAICVESGPGVGTTFELLAHISEQTAKQVGAAALLFKPPSRNELAEAVAPRPCARPAPATLVTARA